MGFGREEGRVRAVKRGNSAFRATWGHIYRSVCIINAEILALR